ncbi:MAG: hypothetical protein KIY12_04230 [Thermoplasmata archaeon]|uniref:Uncharacterized protein n=1 Tax=Candidatus Sysuiplasma superficiale TaxID=2823368 RepID=A0A8J8CD22_9ARCH|nr:hypothetical protein [Candidatus Sysuiplasma superficiale]
MKGARGNGAEHLKAFFVVTAVFAAFLCVLFYWAPALGVQEELAKYFITFRYPVLSRTTSLLMGFLCAANVVAVLNIHGSLSHFFKKQKKRKKKNVQHCLP